MVQEITRRSQSEYLPEHQYLEGRLADVDKAFGAVAARLGSPTPLTQPLDTLDRARELVGDLKKQIWVRPLEEAIDRQLAWLDRAEDKLDRDDGEPVIAYNRIELDRHLLRELRAGWHATRN